MLTGNNESTLLAVNAAISYPIYTDEYAAELATAINGTYYVARGSILLLATIADRTVQTGIDYRTARVHENNSMGLYRFLYYPETAIYPP